MEYLAGNKIERPTAKHTRQIPANTIERIFEMIRTLGVN
jgi:hypothetical protein